MKVQTIMMINNMPVPIVSGGCIEFSPVRANNAGNIGQGVQAVFDVDGVTYWWVHVNSTGDGSYTVYPPSGYRATGRLLRVTSTFSSVLGSQTNIEAIYQTSSNEIAASRETVAMWGLFELNEE